MFQLVTVIHQGNPVKDLANHLAELKSLLSTILSTTLT